MEFKEIADLLHLCQGELTAADYVLELFDNAMDEPSEYDNDDAINPLAGRVSRSLQKYRTGESSIQKADAIKIRHRFNKDKFATYIQKKLNNEMLEAVAIELRKRAINVEASSVPIKCAELLYECIVTLSERTKTKKGVSKKNEFDIDANLTPPSAAITSPLSPEAKASIHRHMKLAETTPPTDVTDYELDYVNAILAVYGEAENIEQYTREHLKSHHRHRNHFKRQRRDFYAAEDVREGTRLAYGSAEKDQFEVLKEEILDAIIEAWEAPHPNGLGRMRKVLEVAGLLESSKCWLCRDTDWIGVRQKKGMCHILVNEGDLEGWVLASG